MKPWGIDEKIISITATRKGVSAYWANDKPEISMTQVEMWALTESGKILGIILMDEMSGEMLNAESSEDFIGYADDEFPLSDKEISERTQTLRECQQYEAKTKNGRTGINPMRPCEV